MYQPTIDCAAFNLHSIEILPYISISLCFSPCSHGEATRGAEAAARETMYDQPGAAEAKQRPG